MVKIYRTEDNIISELQAYEEGSWINMVAPSLEECVDYLRNTLIQQLNEEYKNLPCE